MCSEVIRLKQVSDALASLGIFNKKECERAFNCKLSLKANTPSHYSGTCPDLWLDLLELRVGKTGGIVVAHFEPAYQAILAKTLGSLGKPIKLELVSPPVSGYTAKLWTKKWQLAYELGETELWFGLEEKEGCIFLKYASRAFTKDDF